MLDSISEIIYAFSGITPEGELTIASLVCALIGCFCMVLVLDFIGGLINSVLSVFRGGRGI